MTLQQYLLTWALGILVCTGLVGCGKAEGPDTVTVKGTVQIDGQPLPEGDILFIRADSDQKGFGGHVVDGKYQVVAEPGTMAVRIVAFRTVPGKFHTVNVNPEPVTEMYIPEKYNSKTTLTIDVKPDLKDPVSFELASK